MNKMTEYQCKLVEENLDIIDWVIRCRVKVNGQVLQTYEDFYQIGCEALCRAAMAYHPERGTFSPLGSRYVYNAIIDPKRRKIAESICFLIEDGEQLARQLAYEKSIDTMEEVGHCLDPSEATALERAEIRKRLLPYFLQLPEYRHLIEAQSENS